MRTLMVLLLWLTPLWSWAQNAPTLPERLDLESLAALKIVTSSGDETHASYRLVSAQGVRPVVGAVRKKLVADGWASHPNLGMGEDNAPNSLTPDMRGEQRLTFVQGRELLEVQVAPVGRSNLVSLRLNLISGEPPRPVAGLATGTS